MPATPPRRLIVLTLRLSVPMSSAVATRCLGERRLRAQTRGPCLTFRYSTADQTQTVDSPVCPDVDHVQREGNDNGSTRRTAQG